MEAKKPFALPQSVSNYKLNLLCCFLFFLSLFLLRFYFPQISIVQLVAIGLLATAIPLWVYDLFVLKICRQPSTGLMEKPGPVDRKRLMTKLIGLYGTFLLILLLYYFLPVYRISSKTVEFYAPFFQFLAFCSPWIIVLSFVYFLKVDPRQKDPYDEYWHMGCLLTGRWRNVNPEFIKEHARVWFIKGFFTPFMFALLVQNVHELFSSGGKFASFLSFFQYLLVLFYTIDVLYGVLGYILTFRLLDTHIRSCDPNFWGWFFCLACYYPFSALFGIRLFPYEDGFYWHHWFALSPWVYYFWGGVIIFATFVYAVATVAFGYRMSNLTYRGIITNGPYRYTKHPAYVGKVASWWLISVPFFAAGEPDVAAINTFNLIVITLIYYFRARTEENHLSNYPEYVEYANWINDHGIFRALKKAFPGLRYSEEKCKCWRSVVWFKKLKKPA